MCGEFRGSLHHLRRELWFLDAEVCGAKVVRVAVFAQVVKLDDLMDAGRASIEGNVENLTTLAGLLDTFDQSFAIVPMPTS
jgi:alkyl sulfatase BDS1-like metallo-beta-lactamase superfamily hydrolase